MSDARRYAYQFKGICDAEIRVNLTAPSWLHESYLVTLLDMASDELKRKVAALHPGP